MNIEKGCIVIVKAGKEKGRPFAVVDVTDQRFVLIADGKKRKLSAPKKKNIIHLRPTGKNIGEITTDRKLREFLSDAILGG